MPTAVTAPRKISCERSSKPIITSRRSDPADRAGLARKHLAICMVLLGRGFEGTVSTCENSFVFHDDDTRDIGRMSGIAALPYETGPTSSASNRHHGFRPASAFC